MNAFKRISVISLSLAFITASSLAMAATDGTLGTTSTGSTDIALTINSLVKISGMQDVNFNYTGGSEDLSNSQNVCVYSNNGDHKYKVLLTTDKGAFNVVDNSNNTVPFSVKWKGAQGGTTAAVYNQEISGLEGSSQLDCSDGKLSQLKVSIKNNDLAGKPNGNTYAATLTAMVEPSV